MHENIAVELKNVSKTFVINQNSYSLFKILSSIVNGHFLYERKIIKVLNKINLRVFKGDFIHIRGENGVGKTTLLKIIIGSILPDEGSTVYTRGKIVKLSLGMGFDQNISARENIYLNGTLLGLSFNRIGNIFKEIIDYAEINDFVDTPIKFFSSGMKSRLAFSIAMHVEADILLIDEFFGGVGDNDFQDKSKKAFENFLKSNKTIILVSHKKDLKVNLDKEPRILYL
jgi:ABC-type polysaccharide/polyol phosphate transport system ATPase subunit